MAKPILATDFKDDIMQEAMNGKRKYRMVNNSDGTVSFEDVTDYEQIGDYYGAGQINATNEAVNQSFDANKIIKDEEVINAMTQDGFVADAMIIKALKNNVGFYDKGIISTEEKLLTSSGTYTVTTPKNCESVKIEKVSSTDNITATVTVNGETFSVSSSDSFEQTVNCNANEIITIESTRNKNTDEMVLKFTFYGDTMVSFYFDFKDGKYGFNTDPSRGADTFNPFSVGDFSSMVYLNAYSIISNSVSYKCIKDTQALIFLVGTQYITSGSIKINGTNIYSYGSSNYEVSFFKAVELKAGDVVSMSINVGSLSGYAVVAGLLHNGGIY